MQQRAGLREDLALNVHPAALEAGDVADDARVAAAGVLDEGVDEGDEDVVIVAEGGGGAGGGGGEGGGGGGGGGGKCTESTFTMPASLAFETEASLSVQDARLVLHKISKNYI